MKISALSSKSFPVKKFPVNSQKTKTESVMSINKMVIHDTVGMMRKICTRYYESTETVHLTYNSEKSYVTFEMSLG